MYGLMDRDLNYILEAVSKFSEIKEVIIFGSRAMGNYKKGSDVDLAIKGEDVDRKIVSKLSYYLNEEYPLPYFFDVLSYKDTSNQELINHIDSLGVSIYKRDDSNKVLTNSNQ